MRLALADRPATEFDCENQLGFGDLEFEKVPTVQYSSGGTAWAKWVPIGMPKIPQETLELAFYLYPSKEAALTGGEFGGTGFFVSVPTVSPEQVFVYAVTNWHVAVQSGASVIRINRRDGATEIFDAGPEDWMFDPRLDIAVLPLRLDPDVHKFKAAPVHLLLTEQIVSEREVGPGDDVFMVGRFVDLDGGAINSPSVRFGNLSTSPTPVKQPNGKVANSYCIDMHSRSGYSGSPVFVYRTPGQDLTKGGIHVGGPNNFMFLLGIHYAQFPEVWEIGETKHLQPANSVPLVTDGRYVKGLSGMTLALPAWRIVEVLNMPKLQAHRDQVNAHISEQQRKSPVPAAEAAIPESEIAEKRDAGLKKALNTPPSPQGK